MNNIANIKRAKRVRRKLKKVNTERFRLSVFKSSKNISAQIIDDVNNKTLVSASSNKKNVTPKKKKADLSVLVADTLTKKALNILKGSIPIWEKNLVSSLAIKACTRCGGNCS